MSSENDAGQERHYPVSRLLDRALVQAINNGDQKAITVALTEQEANWVTEAISNRLIVRTFLINQKRRLMALDDRLVEQQVPTEATRHVREYLRELKAEFAEAFISTGAEDRYIKLSGDKLFREALSTEGESLVPIARQLAKVDAAALTPPDKVLGWAQYIRNSITEALWEVVQVIEEDGVNSKTIAAAKLVIAEQIVLLDRHVQGSLPRV